jgi:hypothetical protein
MTAAGSNCSVEEIYSAAVPAATRRPTAANRGQTGRETIMKPVYKAVREPDDLGSDLGLGDS